MSDESLKTLITGLRSELGQAHDLSAETRDLLLRLAHEVEEAFESPQAGSPVVTHQLRDRLADRVRELEASHPRLSTTLGNLVDTLAFYNL